MRPAVAAMAVSTAAAVGGGALLLWRDAPPPAPAEVPGAATPGGLQWSPKPFGPDDVRPGTELRGDPEPPFGLLPPALGPYEVRPPFLVEPAG